MDNQETEVTEHIEKDYKEYKIAEGLGIDMVKLRLDLMKYIYGLKSLGASINYGRVDLGITYTPDYLFNLNPMGSPAILWFVKHK